jgi:hypothetical protein
MKRILLVASLLVASVCGLNAQQVGPQWVTIKSANLRCWECRDNLDRYLLKEKGLTENGIVQWKINLLQGEIRIQYLPDHTNPDALRITLNNAGFDADNEKADPEAYKKIPPSCKRAEDGGGPQKGKPCHIAPN